MQVPDAAQRAPGLLVVAGAVLAFVVSVAAFSLGKVDAGIATASVGMLVLSAGLSWLAMERRRVRDHERGIRLRNRQAG
ncbi:LapA family protein [Mycobacterium vicinigordonae]|uniref:LapA family protein n=1 Tax=Mycobacterium vicinigordonae TaxID=1719132 RepID=A0A7D6HY24_9MYCO|nr:LapA family protein [Mycobacterium vicinigordonae]